MPDREFAVMVEVPIYVVVHDPSVIDRCVENHDDKGDSMAPGQGGWRDNFYDIDSAEEVIRHLAYNRIFNGVENVSRLDGWADLTEEAVTISMDRRGAVYQINEVS